MSRSRVVLSALALLLAGSTGQAALRAGSGNPLGVNSREPIAVNADSFLADLNGDTGTYTGNVIDGTASGADTATLSSIQTVKIELSTLAKYADLQTGLRPVITLDSFVTLPNCSQLGTGSVRC